MRGHIEAHGGFGREHLGGVGVPAPLCPLRWLSSRVGSPAGTPEPRQDPAGSTEGDRGRIPTDAGWQWHPMEGGAALAPGITLWRVRMRRLRSWEEGKPLLSARAEPAPAPSCPRNSEMRSPRDPPALPGTPGPAPADTDSAAPRPPSCKHRWANRSSSLRAPHQLRTPGHRARGWGCCCSRLGTAPSRHQHTPNPAPIAPLQPAPWLRVPLGWQGARWWPWLICQSLPGPRRRLQLPHYYSARSLPEQPARLWWEEAGRPRCCQQSRPHRRP